VALKYVQHEKVYIKKHPEFNEAWLQDRIADDPSMLGLGDVRVLDRERKVTSGGRLDLLLLDEENNRRFEVELMLGATDPSHIIRTIEYWDIERRRYPGYEHIAVLIAEDITTRFLNVISLLSGSIPLIAIQLDAIRVEDKILLNFLQVLDQTDLRTDDTDDEDSGGGETNRQYWEQRSGASLIQDCDQIVGMINDTAKSAQELNYMRGYIGLRSNGVVKNFIHFRPKHTKNIVHIVFRNANASAWKDRFEEAGLRVQSRYKRQVRISVNAEELEEHAALIKEAIDDTVKEHDA
jgi:hypothetical protein